MTAVLSAQSVLSAAWRLQGRVHRTPVMKSRTLNTWLKAEVFFKCENLQRSGSFKFRGATNALARLLQGPAPRCVVTHSSGNHAQALALAAREHGVPCTVVMPRGAPPCKRQAVLDYGAQVVPCDDSLSGRRQVAQQVLDQTGGVLIHPYEHPDVVAGQGTAMLEFWDQAGPLHVVLVPVGGGGLATGTLLALEHLDSQTQLVGVEPEVADDARRSLAQGRLVPGGYPPTVADGLRTDLGQLAFSLLRGSSRFSVVTVSEQGIKTATRWIWSRLKLVVEPSAAVPLAALLEQKICVQSKRVGIILTGGNFDCQRLPL